MRIGVILSTIATFSIAATPILFGGDVPPVAARRQPLRVVLDVTNHLALVPEGTILPAGLKVYISTDRRPNFLNPPPRNGYIAKVTTDANRQHAPFVFAYAPAEVFAKLPSPMASRKVGRARSLTSSCVDDYFYAPETPLQDCQDCSVTLRTSACTDSMGDYQYDSYSAEVNLASVSVAEVASSDPYLNCYSVAWSPQENVSCGVGDLRQYAWWQTGSVTLSGYVEFWRNATTYPFDLSVEYPIWTWHVD